MEGRVAAKFPLTENSGNGSASPSSGFLKIIRYLLVRSFFLEEWAAFLEIIIFFLFYYACSMWHLYFNAL